MKDKRSDSDDLAHFISLLDVKPADDPDFSAQKWDQRAEMWKTERVNNRKGDERVVSAMNYLEHRSLLQEHFDIADIGCGPGRFVAAFAKRVHRVVGLDISPKMVAHGREYLQSEGLDNAVLRTCDFQALDIEKEGYKGAFDLVFSSMTPAIRGMDALMKSMEMSRAWCCHITHLSGQNLLRERITREVFGRNPAPQWTGRGFYALFNVLFLMGYHPETSYEKRQQDIWIHPDEEYVAFLMEHMLPSQEMTADNAQKILRWLHSQANEDGLVMESTRTSYGRILWDVRDKTERPDRRA